ncbi:hypothetical protein JTE90_003955 [Oedothorax gibbosus]|uniref:Uncharacterized protein n=1 Tax=Oedothorax gibbosus TaxID=931172 RepID=A0AAV6UWW7_9ARAC|nr:hypothetical protein JTE90_003955 [Oedothorax gibbosus]
MQAIGCAFHRAMAFHRRDQSTHRMEGVFVPNAFLPLLTCRIMDGSHCEEVAAPQFAEKRGEESCTSPGERHPPGSQKKRGGAGGWIPGPRGRNLWPLCLEIVCARGMRKMKSFCQLREVPSPQIGGSPQ